MEQINMVRKPCPIPVIEAKKAIRAAEPGQTVQILVDNDVARQNLQKMAAGIGCSFAYEAQPDGNVLVTLTAREACAVTEQDAGFVVAVGTCAMGRGDDELGAMLMKSYLYSLTQLDFPPATMLFFNSGVKLTTEGSASIEDLKALEEKGTAIVSCGACLDFYSLKEKLQVGSVTNMYAIAEAMAGAARLVNL